MFKFKLTQSITNTGKKNSSPKLAKSYIMYTRFFHRADPNPYFLKGLDPQHKFIHNNNRLQGKPRPHTGYLSSAEENGAGKEMVRNGPL